MDTIYCIVIQINNACIRIIVFVSIIIQKFSDKNVITALFFPFTAKILFF